MVEISTEAVHGGPMTATNPYETDSLLREYLMLHFGRAEDIFGNLPGPREAAGFAQRCVNDLIDLKSLTPSAKALDVGCAVGGSAFELAVSCSSVLGVDYSRGFIEAARRLAAEGSVASSVLIEAGRMAPFEAVVPGAGDRSRVRFEVGDAMALDPTLAGFDVVLAANLICRLPEPAKFLDRLPSLVAPGGQLLLATPFTWLEDYTPCENWLGRSKPGIEELGDKLAPHFALEHQTELPFVIREHARKFQYGVSHGTRWRRLS